MMIRKKSGGKPDERFEAEWQKLVEAFDALLLFIKKGYKKPSKEEAQAWYKQNMEAYSRVYNLCTRHEGAKSGINCAQVLYQRLKELIEQHLRRDVAERIVGKTGEQLLVQVHKEWDAHRLMVRWVQFMFRYLDEYYTKNPNIAQLQIMMLTCFNTSVYENIKGDLRSVILESIKSERNGNSINREVLKSAISLLIDMGMNSLTVYEKDFEETFLEQTRQYYEFESNRWLGDDGGQFLYLTRAEGRLLEEARRAEAILAPSTKQPLLRRVEEQLLEEKKERCMRDPDAGTEALLVSGKYEELGRMYRLFNRLTNGLDVMSQILKNHIEKEGKEINARFTNGGGGGAEGETAGTAYIRSCLELHDKYTRVFSDHLDDHEMFAKARKGAYETFFEPPAV